jgi:diaminohydroxyphosphoribosylaminopyrimidine deaminase/5-amino-6-(5-phosphoribosylamino)uracil reductase
LNDADYMKMACDLAQTNLGLTDPNPVVGCVIVLDHAIVGQGVTAPGGRPHAEEQALQLAGTLALGATAYVTLEPCGARSAGGMACSVNLAQAGVARVVYACEDGSPFASGRGSERLREAGVIVESGLMATEISKTLNY